MQWEPIIAASITGLLAFAAVVWQSRKTRRINTDEHSENSRKLDYLADLFRDHLKGHK